MILVVDYGMGNLGSLLNMLKKVGAKDARVSGDPSEIERADKLILPGVGAFDTGIQRLRHAGLIEILREKVLARGTPTLGVCLGMQLMTHASEEGTLPGLGWIDGHTVRLRFDPALRVKVPHMGWNTVEIRRAGTLFQGMFPDARFYFVHSFHVVPSSAEDVLTTTRYGDREIVSAIQRGHIMATQFHPEKSHKFGMMLFKNFLEGVAC
jgi:glutamine amidotransferase